jgi:hypothetical protein
MDEVTIKKVEAAIAPIFETEMNYWCDGMEIPCKPDCKCQEALTAMAKAAASVLMVNGKSGRDITDRLRDTGLHTHATRDDRREAADIIDNLRDELELWRLGILKPNVNVSGGHDKS